MRCTGAGQRGQRGAWRSVRRAGSLWSGPSARRAPGVGADGGEAAAGPEALQHEEGDGEVDGVGGWRARGPTERGLRRLERWRYAGV